MKKKIKKAVKAFFKPTMKHECVSLQDQLNALQSRFKSMEQWRWTLSEEFKNGKTTLEQHAGQRPDLRDAMNDVANTVEYMLKHK